MADNLLPPLDKDRALAILREILIQPTAPFHEHRVRKAVQGILESAGIRCRVDSSGNLLATYRRGSARPIAFTGHMDHPGFELVKVEGESAEALWNGQVPTFNLKGLKLALWSDDENVGRRGTAEVLEGDGRKPLPKCRDLRLKVPPSARPGDFGYADLEPIRLESGKIFSKAFDDLGGCSAVVACLDHLARHRLPGNVHALFTRAEEVGFHGTLGAIRTGTLQRSRPVVVLECSKAMPGAEHGKGPVIRVGDRARIFDPDLIAACEDAASRLRKAQPELAFQRRLMDGGTCEASAFGLAGYSAVCLAFPLGNYHNVGPEGVEPEYIMERDFSDGVSCLTAFAVWGLDPKAARKRLVTWVKDRFGAADARRLKQSA